MLCWSPSATNVPVPDVNQHLLAELQFRGDWDLADACWLGEMCKAAHLLIINTPALHPKDVWYLGLMYFQDSGILVWPGTLEVVPFHMGKQWWKPDLTITEPVFTIFVNVDDTKAYQLEWHS